RPGAGQPRGAAPVRGDAADRGTARPARGGRTAGHGARRLPAAAQRGRLRRARRPRRPGRPPLREAVGRTAAARAVRARDLRPPAPAVPRRADHRPGHRRAPGPVGRGARAGGRRQRGAAHHALPGGSRGALGPGRGARRRPPGRGRQRRRGPRAGVAAPDPVPLAPGRRRGGAVAGRGRGGARGRRAAGRGRTGRAGGAAPARRRPRHVRPGVPPRRPGRRLPRPDPVHRRPAGGRLMHTTTLRAPLRAHLAEARCELVGLAREPAFGVPVLAFPAMFYLLFAVVLNRGNPGAAAYLLASYGAFGVVGAALFGFGVTIAMDRERGYLRLRRTLPTPPGSMLLAKMAMAVLFAAAISLLLATLAATAGG